MATIAHSTLTGAELHEPKGIAGQASGKVYVSDGSNSGAWSALLPVGLIAPYASATPPSLWLECFGQAVSRTTYSALFTVTSTTYGIGDGSTTFNVPDLDVSHRLYLELTLIITAYLPNTVVVPP